jgi:hypothetical protein
MRGQVRHMTVIRNPPATPWAVMEWHKALWVPLLPETDRERLTKAEDVLRRAGLGEL